MSNDVEIVVTGTDKTKPMFDSVKASIKDLGGSFGGLRERVKETFTDIEEEVKTKLKETTEESKDRGKDIGRSLMGSIGDAVKSGAVGLKDHMTDAFSGGLKGMLSSPIIGPIVTAALATVAIAVAGPIATLIGGLMIMAIGGGIVGMGTMLLLQNEKLKKQMSKSWEGIQKGLAKSFEPLIPVIEFVMKGLGKVAKMFEPVIEATMKFTAGPLKGFMSDLGKAFLELKPAMVPIMDAFSQILAQLGPALPGAFKSIGHSLSELGHTFSENSDLFAALFLMLLQAIPPVIDTIGWLTRTFREILMVSIDVFSGIASGALGMADVVLAAVQSMLEALSQIPGPWQESMQSAAASVGEARKAVQGWQSDVNKMAKTVKLNADINQLQAKLTTARRALKDPDLSKERKAKINADIRSLQSQIAKAKSTLASINGRRATTFIDTIYRYSTTKRVGSGSVLRPGLAHGGNVGAFPGGGGVEPSGRYENGGVSGMGGTAALVGEEGPEIVRLPFGSTVTPAGQTRTMLGQMGGVGGGSQPIAITLIIAGKKLGEIVIDPLRKEIRTRGGDVQAVLGR